MCLGTLPIRYGHHLNKVLYPRLDQVTALLAQDTMYPASIPSYEVSEMIVVHNPRLVSYEYAVMLNRDLCEQYGGTPGVRSVGSLAYALDIPRMTAFGEIAYPELARATAHMVEALACGHVFTDGNKRTAWHIASMYCASNGWLLEPEYPEDGRDAILALCTHQWGVEDLAQWINDNLFKR